MGVNYCKAEEPELDKFEENRSDLKNNEEKETIIPKKPAKFEVIPFDLATKTENNPEWQSNIWESIRVVETPGKEFQHFATSRINAHGKQQVMLGSMGTLVEDAKEGEYAIGDQNKFMSERLHVVQMKNNFYSVNGIDNIKLDGDLTVLCNVDFEDLFPEDLVKEVSELDYFTGVYRRVKEKLFAKNFLFR